MTDFEFLSVLVSIVVGLALTRLLGGLGHAYHFRRVSKMSPVHVAWTVTVFFIIVLNWWVFLLWREFDAWTFTTYFLVIIWTTLMYMMAVALYPPRLAEDADYEKLFDDNRTWLLLTYASFGATDLVIASIREGQLAETMLLVFVGHYIVLTLIGAIVRNRKFDLFLAWWIAGTLAVWSFGVRNTLG